MKLYINIYINKRVIYTFIVSKDGGVLGEHDAGGCEVDRWRRTLQRERDNLVVIQSHKTCHFFRHAKWNPRKKQKDEHDKVKE